MLREGVCSACIQEYSSHPFLIDRLTMPRAIVNSDALAVQPLLKGNDGDTRALGLCKKCLKCTLLKFRLQTRTTWWCTHCGVACSCEPFVLCPHRACGQRFQFEGQARCPFCAGQLADGIPLRPLPWRARFLDLLIAKRRRDLQVHRERTEAEFLALREAWKA